MKTLGALGVLSASPLCSACRFVPPFSIQDLRPVCPTVLSAAFSTTPARSKSAIRAADPRLALHVAASYSGKGRQFQSHRDTQHPGLDDKIMTGRPRSGQDSYFISRVGSTDAFAFGVADGVGGWADSGVDSADFSHALSARMAREARAFQAYSEDDSLGPRQLLDSAYTHIVDSEEIGAGGSTACIAIAHPDGTLNIAKYKPPFRVVPSLLNPFLVSGILASSICEKPTWQMFPNRRHMPSILPFSCP